MAGVCKQSMEISDSPVVSVIIPVYNGEMWIEDCLQSIVGQDVLSHLSVEIVVFNDSSTDNTLELLLGWQEKIKGIENLEMVIIASTESVPKGVGFAKNRAISESRGQYLCFQDIDDIMLPSRISQQLRAAADNETAIVGSRFRRIPENSTERFTRWANNLKPELLTVQIYTSNGPTIIMPTWFCSRSVFNRVGGFVEDGRGTPEDLIFFYKHLDCGGKIVRVDEELVLYRFHPQATTFSISESTIWDLRVSRLEKKVLKHWTNFTIWNAGKQGRKFFKSLSTDTQNKVLGFCDVDVNKIGRNYENFDANTRKVTACLPIRHFTVSSPPFIICVKLDMSNGEFENNLNTLDLTEGLDYVIFS